MRLLVILLLLSWQGHGFVPPATTKLLRKHALRPSALHCADPQEREKRIKKVKKAIRLVEKLKTKDYLSLTNDQRTKLKTEDGLVETLGTLLVPGEDQSLEEIMQRIAPLGRFALANAAKDLEDRELLCVDCAKDFLFSSRDQAFYAAKGFVEPVRCLPCRRRKEAYYESSVKPAKKTGSKANKANRASKK
ncbi:unnamed protein product [Chrysoparadoxa australica]